jgi:hypothetical protein
MKSAGVEEGMTTFPLPSIGMMVAIIGNKKT